ncbi:hypothetical protein [Streptomyces sp. NPDC127105]|uniref:hypothetical protein n=1 Tax=Streptomyces sp. NPDC127105 TaxID=3345359 RepID=UPI00365B0EAF
MLYESAARVDEVLCLNVEDLYPTDKRGKITAKGRATEWSHWQSGTARLLPRLIACRTRGPLRTLLDRLIQITGEQVDRVHNGVPGVLAEKIR